MGALLTFTAQATSQRIGVNGQDLAAQRSQSILQAPWTHIVAMENKEEENFPEFVLSTHGNHCPCSIYSCGTSDNITTSSVRCRLI